MLVSARISFGGRGAPAELLITWFEGYFDLIVSKELLGELKRVLLRPKFRGYTTPEETVEYVNLLRRMAILEPEPPGSPESFTPDPKDDYLVALARSSGANFLVSGDPHLTGIIDPRPPVLSPRAFLEMIKL